MHFKAACQFGFVLFFTAQGRMFVTVFPMVCHILAFLVSFYIKNLSQTVQCLYFGAELPLQVPAGPCPPRRASAAARALPALSHREPRPQCLFQFPFGIKVFHLADMSPDTFFVIAAERSPVTHFPGGDVRFAAVEAPRAGQTHSASLQSNSGCSSCCFLETERFPSCRSAQYHTEII